MAFWNKRRDDSQESEIMAVLRDLPVVRKELDAREAKKYAQWLTEKAKHREAIAKLDAEREVAERRDTEEVAMALEAYGRAREQLTRLEYAREARRGDHARQVMMHAGALKALGAPALEACYAEAQQKIEAARKIRVGWQDAKALDAYMLALISVREQAEGGVTRGGHETDEEFVARLWASVPTCPAPSAHAPAPPISEAERRQLMFANSAMSTAHLRH